MTFTEKYEQLKETYAAHADFSRVKADLAAGSELAYGASLAAGRYILYMSSLSPDDTYRYVMKRENELTVQTQKAAYERVITATAPTPAANG